MTTLVILAAGLGSRYGATKQLAVFGPQQRTLMEYNIFHAARAGFHRVVFVIREELRAVFETDIIPGLPDHMSAVLINQSLCWLPDHCQIAANRVKPLGTAHALWCCKEQLAGDFAVINADDYYGEHAFELMLANRQRYQNHHLMVAFEVEKTLSAHGSVNRGVCTLSADNLLLSIEECEDITRCHDVITGKLTSTHNTQHAITAGTLVSMNCWFFNVDIFTVLESYIRTRLNESDSLKTECYLPGAVMQHIKQDNKKVKVLRSQEQWLGLTYAEDYNLVMTAINQMDQQGLFSNI